MENWSDVIAERVKNRNDYVQGIYKSLNSIAEELKLKNISLAIEHLSNDPPSWSVKINNRKFVLTDKEVETWQMNYKTDASRIPSPDVPLSVKDALIKWLLHNVK